MHVLYMRECECMDVSVNRRFDGGGVNILVGWLAGWWLLGLF